MREIVNISGVAHAIQLAIAPVFLLTAVGSLLGVITNRLARVIDRARMLEAKLEATAPEHAPAIRSHLKVLSRRARYINIAITACTVAALLVCAVIAILFFGSYIDFDSRTAVSLSFILAMLALMIETDAVGGEHDTLAADAVGGQQLFLIGGERHLPDPTTDQQIIKNLEGLGVNHRHQRYILRETPRRARQW